MSCDKLTTYPVRFSAGDTLPEVGFRYGLPLTGLTFTLTLTQPDGTQIQRDHVNVNEANGEGKFTFQAGDLVSGFNQLVTVDLDNGAGGEQRVAKFLLDVDEA